MAKVRGQEELIVGLDIGSTKVCCVIGEVTDEGIDIIGVGSQPSRGLDKGVVINIEATVKSIKDAVNEAEVMAGVEARSVYASVAGGHIKGMNSHGIVALHGSEVTPGDVAEVVRAARAVPLPTDRQVIHVLPQEYIIDGQGGVKEPVGMGGVRLESKVHIVTGARKCVENVTKCCQRVGLEVADLVVEQVASSQAVLSEDEKELGVALVDIGGGTTDIIIYAQGSIVHTSVLTLGGYHLTNDIAVGLRTPMVDAERVKQRYGCAMMELVKPEEQIQVPSVGGRPARTVSRQILCDIIEPRVEEIFALVGRELQLSGYEDQIASGVVITGGATMMEGMVELAERVLKLPVRRGTPMGVGGLSDVVRSPRYATGVGLVLYGAEADRFRPFTAGPAPGPRRLFPTLREWLGEIF